MDYKVVIPSYDRLNQMQYRTLSFLNRHKIDTSRIYIFAHPLCYEFYLSLKNKYPKINIIESKGGIKNSRNYINEYFSQGTKIVEIDDDVEDLINLLTGESLEDLDGFISESFSMCGNGIWGVSALNNKFFSSMKDKFGLQSIVATFCGYVLNKNIRMTLDVMEDYERVIQFHLQGRNIFKRSWVGIKTKYWTNKGGIQTELDYDRRFMLQNYCSDELAAKYPDLVYQRTRKSGLKDIRFKKIKYN